jgi:hypothetical protein
VEAVVELPVIEPVNEFPFQLHPSMILFEITGFFVRSSSPLRLIHPAA